MVMRILLFLLLICSLDSRSETTIYLFGEKESNFHQGYKTKNAVEKGVDIKFYEVGLRKKIEDFLSSGLGNDPFNAQKILQKRIDENKNLLDQLANSVVGEQLIIKHEIKKFPSILIDGQVFNTSNIDEALEFLK